tara:strand:+ start:82 stop:552 length:471 start_codon:yes stop_codon:yes gene_type:complete
MKYLKEKFGKYFQFKNTINGTDYFLRGLSLILFFIPIGIFVGIGVALISTNPALAGLLVGLGGLLLIPTMWFSLATTYKRINSFFPNKAGWLVAATFVYSMILEGFNPNNGMAQLNESAPTLPNGDYITYVVLLIPSLIWSLYLLFGNSTVKKHIG